MSGEKDLKACKSCRVVVMRTYGELRSRGIEKEAAYRAALKVLVLRHPERRGEDFAAVASEWIFGSIERG